MADHPPPESVNARLQRAMNAHDLEALVGCFDAEYLSDQPAHPNRAFRSPEGVRKHWSWFFENVPDFQAELHCYCSICRRFCGAGYGTFFQVRRQQFRLLAGKEHLQRYRSSPWAQRVFCNTCGSSLFGEPDGVPALGIALASMLGPIDREPER